MESINHIGVERNKMKTTMYLFHYGSGGWKGGLISKKRGKMVKRALYSLSYGMSISNTSKSTGLSLRRCKVILKQLQGKHI